MLKCQCIDQLYTIILGEEKSSKTCKSIGGPVHIKPELEL